MRDRCLFLSGSKKVHHIGVDHDEAQRIAAEIREKGKKA